MSLLECRDKTIIAELVSYSVQIIWGKEAKRKSHIIVNSPGRLRLELRDESYK